MFFIMKKNMPAGQLSLYKNDNSQIVVNKVEFKETVKVKKEDLFCRYTDSIDIETYSFSLGFVNEIIRPYKKVRLLIGSKEIAIKCSSLSKIYKVTSQKEASRAERDSSCTVPIMFAQEALKETIRYKNIVDKIKNGTLEIRVFNNTIDHAKRYLMCSSCGTLTITGSPNASFAAWDGEYNVENIDVDYSQNGYNARKAQFDAIWDDAVQLPFIAKAINSIDDKDNNSSDLFEAALVSLNEVLVLQEISDSSETISEKDIPVHFKDTYSDTRKAIKKIPASELYSRTKDNTVVAIGKILEKRKIQKQSTSDNSSKEETTNCQINDFRFIYEDDNPFVYKTDKIILNGKEYLLSKPDENLIKKDIKTISRMFNNFDKYFFETRKGAIKEAKDKYFKEMCYLFASPFIANLRCAYKKANVAPTGLPLVLLVNSKRCDGGKTFMTHCFLKLMTGKNTIGTTMNAIQPKKNGQSKLDQIKDMERSLKAIPIFIDELSKSDMSQNAYKNFFKNDSRCEENMNKEQPVLVFTSNGIDSTPDIIRKRLLHFQIEICRKETTKDAEINNESSEIRESLTNNLYLEYLRKMLPLLSGEIYGLLNGCCKNIDLFKLSSKIICEIFEEYGENDYNIDFCRLLNWQNDYSINAQFQYQSILDEIVELKETEPQIFELSKNTKIVKITGKKSDLDVWSEMLPAEAGARVLSGSSASKSDFVFIELNKSWLEDKTNHSFNLSDTVDSVVVDVNNNRLLTKQRLQKKSFFNIFNKRKRVNL